MLACMYNLHPNAYIFMAQWAIKIQASLKRLIHLEEIVTLMFSLLTYTFKNACLLLQLVLWAAGEGWCRWIWDSLFFLPL